MTWQHRGTKYIECPDCHKKGGHIIDKNDKYGYYRYECKYCSFMWKVGI